jgi:hypothetical protein
MHHRKLRRLYSEERLRGERKRALGLRTLIAIP